MTETQIRTSDRPEPGWDNLPGHRKSDAVVLLLFLFVPVGLFIIWTGPVYIKTDGGFRIAPLTWKMTVSAIALAAMMLLYQWQVNSAIETATIPGCGSSEAVDTAERAIEQSPSGKIQGFRLIAIKSASEISWNPDKQTRVCSFVGLTNVGVREGVMTLTWLDRSRATYYVSVMFD